MISSFLILFLIPVFLSIVITPWIMRLATLVGATDLPNERKIHRYPVPRMGGVAIYLSFMLSLLFLYLLDPALHIFSLMIPQKGAMLIGSLLLVLVLGLIDDLRTLTPGQKVVVQVCAATIVFMAGFRIPAVSYPFGDGVLELGMFAYPVTVLWIVGITNAFNLIDGLDGLSSGVAIIASLTMCAISLLNGDVVTASLVLVLAGAVLGFLRYNFNPARVFLGDSGSLFIGFALSVLSIQSLTKGSTAVAILVPILALGLPIMDTLLSMVRRLLRSLLPVPARHESFLHKLHFLFLPDRAHIHHQLIARGVSHRNVVLLLYLVSCAFGMGAFAITFANNVGASLILVAVAVATIVGIRQLRYKEMAILRNGVLLPMYQSPLLYRGIFLGFVDLGFTALAFALAYSLTFPEAAGEERALFSLLTIVCSTQLVVLYFSGLYKSSFRHLGIGDLLRIMKATGLAIIATGVVFSVLSPSTHVFSPSMLVLNFYLLFSLIAGIRLSFHVLNYLFHREAHNGKEILIYGAGANGIIALQLVLNKESLRMHPVGFLDDNPQLEGKRLNDFPIFGGHWKLSWTFRRFHIDQILISCDTMKPEIMNRLRLFAGQHGIILTKCSVLLENFATETGQTLQTSAGSFFSQRRPRPENGSANASDGL